MGGFYKWEDLHTQVIHVVGRANYDSDAEGPADVDAFDAQRQGAGMDIEKTGTGVQR